jgi:N utilization substance protein A
VVPDEQLSLAIGRRGQNVRLASQLTGLDIDILTEEEESKRRQAEFEERTKLFMDTLDLDEFFAQLLVSEGFTNARGSRLCRDGRASGDRRRRRGHRRRASGPCPRLSSRRRTSKALEKARELGVEDSLIEFEGLTPQMLRGAGEDGVKTLEDFATCADWELAGGWTTVDGERVKDDGLLEPFDVSLEEAQNMVMTARDAGLGRPSRSLEAASRRRSRSRRRRTRNRGGRGLRAKAPGPRGAAHDAGRPEKDREDGPNGAASCHRRGAAQASG